MAGKLDQLNNARPHRALKKIEAPVVDNNKPEEKEEVKENIREESRVFKKDQLSKITPNRTMLSEIGNTKAEKPKETEEKLEKEEKQVKTKTEKNDKKTESTKVATEIFTIRMLSREDQEFLKRGCRICGYKSMQDFFVSLVEEDKNNSKIDFTDENHKEIFTCDKRFITSTARVTPEIKALIKTQAAKHRMYDGEYKAYLVHKKRMETEGWN